MTLKILATMAYLFCLILSGSSVWAEDLATLDGRNFSNIRVTKVEADGIRVLHDTGGSKILLKDLPPEWRSRYAGEVRRAAEQAAAAAEQISIIPTISADHPKLKEIEKGRVWLIGTVTEIRADGLMLYCRQPEIWDSFEPAPKGLDKVRADYPEATPATARVKLCEKWVRSGADLLQYFSYLSLIQRRDSECERLLPKRVAGSLFVKNHPDQSKLYPDNLVCVFAYPDGVLTVESALGTQPLPAYNYRVPESILKAEIQPEP